MTRYTIGEIATALEVDPGTIRGYKSRGFMPEPTGYVGRTPYWTAAKIEPWIEKQRQNRRHVGR